ncbi:MAG TPA: hypothetical protein VJS67_04725 [Pseudonocardiaceae bacterium]|nr:hypothetical protein [Pseudonocardiaceae bacterium]
MIELVVVIFSLKVAVPTPGMDNVVFGALPTLVGLPPMVTVPIVAPPVCCPVESI